MRVIARLESEFADFEAAVQYFTHYTTETTQSKLVEHKVKIDNMKVMFLFVFYFYSFPPLSLYIYIYIYIFTNIGYDIRSNFKRSLTGLNSEFPFF